MTSAVTSFICDFYFALLDIITVIRFSLVSLSLGVCVCVERNVGQTLVNRYFHNKFLLSEGKQWQTLVRDLLMWRSLIAQIGSAYVQ